MISPLRTTSTVWPPSADVDPIQVTGGVARAAFELVLQTQNLSVLSPDTATRIVSARSAAVFTVDKLAAPRVLSAARAAATPFSLFRRQG